jgi:Right handed beta helix region
MKSQISTNTIHGLKYTSLLLLTFSLASCHSQTTDYYLDAGNGQDQNNGRTPSTAWKSLKKINSTKFKPGDRILLKKGEVWHEKLLLSGSGTPDNPIIFASYGDGEKPVVSAWDTLNGWVKPSNWISLDRLVWYISCQQDPKRIWLTEKEYRRSINLSGLDSTARWFYDEPTHRLYIYSPGNPSQYYKGIVAAAVRDAAVIGRNVSDIVLRDLSIQGGGLYSLHLNNCQRITIESCQIGHYSGKYGILVSQSSNGIIRNCAIDSGLRLKYDFEYYAVEDGVKLYNGCTYWKIFDNQIQDWGHSGIQIQSRDKILPTSNNEVYHNTISAKNVAYCRGFEIAGPEGSCQFNKIYGNYIVNTTVRNQILGDHNSIYYNVVSALRNVSYRNEGTAQAFSFSNHEGNACHHNQLFNNVIFDSDEPAIILRSHELAPISDNQIVNNITFECGRNSKNAAAGSGLVIGADQKIFRNTFQNNNFYNSGKSEIISYRGKEMTVAQFDQQHNTSKDQIGQNLQSNPLFIDAAKSDFKLKAGSPCIDTGQNVQLSTDFDGKSVPQGKGVDIGSYEFMEK